MVVNWLVEQFAASPLGAGPWLTLSFVLAGVATIVTRMVAPKLEQSVRTARWILVPYVGLLFGALSPRLMGLGSTDWASGLIVGVVAVSGLFALLALIRIWLETDTEATGALAYIGQSSGPSLIESCAQEFHWCFLRGGVLDLLLTLVSPSPSPQYWAVWIAAAISLPGVFVRSSAQSDRLLAVLILLTTSSLFLFTQSFWLCCLLHLGIRFILLWGTPERQGAL